MFFRYIKVLALKFSGEHISDCVVTVPAFYSYKERHSIIQAIQLSNLNLLALVNENVAAAIHFATEKKLQLNLKSKKYAQYIIFYNMGGSYTQASLVKYHTEMSNVAKKNVTTTFIEVRIMLSNLKTKYLRFLQRDGIEILEEGTLTMEYLSI